MSVKIIALLLATVLGTVAAPNVVFLLSDDQSWGDYGFMDHPHIETPHLDELASKGLLYERGYVTAPLCRPSLASIVSGQYPHQTGIRGNDPVLPNNATRTSNRELWAEFTNRMDKTMEGKPSFIQLLKENGYNTLQTGKWWEGDPKNHGFTHAMTHGDITKGGRHGDLGLKIGRTTMKPIYDFVAESQAQKKPFFIWYGVFLPHAPHNAPERLFNKYKDFAPNEPTAWYWANVEWLDETCGELINHLKETGTYENTLFVYTCDNGWVQNPEKKNVSIRSKREPVEAGIRTPIFLTHGDQIEPRRDTTTLASNLDIAPTILKACGIEIPAEMKGLDLLSPKNLQERGRIFVDVYEHDSDIDQLDNLDDGLRARVVIDGWDKLIAWTDRKELYNLQTDPDDQKNLFSQNPEKVEKLSGLIDDLLRSSTRQESN
ncbi:sulfatase-like hydrolase/transferase [Roseibacillus persicicus]|uniref:sulfatase-like hydrolase/transferase n=1 Tax=Roseibacillus persicicus TaxID=454148 RepID=UPI00398AA16A